MLSAAVTVSACTHTDCGWQQEDRTHSTMSYTSAILPCSASTNPVSGAESAPVCGCQSRRLPVLTANWALFSEVPEAGSPPRKACIAGSSLSQHLIIQPVWDYTTLPHHVLVINYFPHLPKSAPIACNQLNEHHSTYIITHARGFPSTASRHLHTCGFPNQHQSSYIRVASQASQYIFAWNMCSLSPILIINSSTMLIIFAHITFSISWVLSSERFPEVKLLRQRSQILL